MKRSISSPRSNRFIFFVYVLYTLPVLVYMRNLMKPYGLLSIPVSEAIVRYQSISSLLNTGNATPYFSANASMSSSPTMGLP